MYGNRGTGRFNNQQGLLGNANVLMGNPMAGVSNMQALLNQSGQRDLRGGAGLFPINPSLGIRDIQQPGGYGVSNRINIPPQAQAPEPVLDILVIA